MANIKVLKKTLKKTLKDDEQKGPEKAERIIAVNLLKKGISVKDVADATGLSEAMVRRLV